VAIKKVASSKHCILISIGSNIDKEFNTRRGIDALHQAFGSITVSPIYESKSIGFDGEYKNIIITVIFCMSLLLVSEIFLFINNKLKRHEKNRI